MKLMNLTKGASFALFASLLITTTSCSNDDSWGDTYGGETTTEKADTEGWELKSTEAFSYSTPAELLANWELITQSSDSTDATIFQRTFEEWSTYCTPDTTKYKFIEMNDLPPVITNSGSVTLAAYAQALTTTEAVLDEETGEEITAAEALVWGTGQVVSISATNASASIITAGDQVPGLGGMIISKDSYSAITAEGDTIAIRINVRAKMNAGKNTYPMVWLMPTAEYNATIEASTDRYTIAKLRYENSIIKFMEHFSEDKGVTQQLCSNYISNWGITSPASSIVTEVDYTEYNDYMVEISSDEVVFYINDVKTLSYPRFDSANQETLDNRFPFLKNFNIVMGVAMGEPPVEAAQSFSFTEPVELEVESIKYYEKK